ncbi:MAG: type II toxin-antitoxin system RelE/ParE family toxin [Nitrospirae bacterium]|nr:type II toxin-antitoxin system RelE/ParE family toxin [Nitrospirota bacterium]
MIVSFKCHDTEKMFKGKRIAKFSGFEAAAMRKLALLNVAGEIDDLRVPPGNRLEALSGKRKGQWSIRINDQSRICFKFKNGNALDVEIVDYH